MRPNFKLELQKRRPSTRGVQKKAAPQEETTETSSSSIFVNRRPSQGLNKNPRNFPSLTQRLELQKCRETKLDTENPKYITSLKYSIKENFNRWKLPSFIEVVNSTTMEKAMMPIDFITQPEGVIKNENNFWKLKKREEQGYILKAGGTQVTIPFEGITAFPNHVKNRQEEQDDIQQLTDGMSRLRIKNKIKRRKS